MVLLIFSIAAAFYDIRKRIIPNWLVLCSILIGMIIGLGKVGVVDTFSSVLRCIAVVFCLLPFYLSGMLGAGDVKFYAVIPLFCIKKMLLIIYLGIFLIAAVPAVWLAVRHIKYDTVMAKIPMAVPMAVAMICAVTVQALGYMELFV